MHWVFWVFDIFSRVELPATVAKVNGFLPLNFCTNTQKTTCLKSYCYITFIASY